VARPFLARPTLVRASICLLRALVPMPDISQRPLWWEGAIGNRGGCGGWQERAVAREEAESWARSKGMLFLEASAKTRVGIKQVFTEVIQKVS
jgi:hypothetical protein